MSRRFMRLIESRQTITVTAPIHARLNAIDHENAGIVHIRIAATSWVRGRTMIATYRSTAGRRVRGKKVPEKRVIGVMKRNIG